ncbi:MAG TPA: DUF2142 domain-containing protein [Kineosporiaceae bacterium]|nr:DUF2142 domain-containing protein [Kineosporiaceae bacterium]
MTGPAYRPWYGMLVFAALALIEVAWAFGLPLGAGPDEPSHVYRAVALVRTGNVIPDDRYRDTEFFVVDVPDRTVRAVGASQCSAGHPSTGNACSRRYHRSWSGSVTRIPSTSARYLWTYYAAVGWPALIDPGPRGIYGLRLVSGLTCAGLLAAAASTMLRLRRPVLPAVGLAAAVTPMATGIAAMVNPSAWEVSGAVLVWACLLGLADPVASQRRSWLLVKLGVGGSAMLLTRQLSVLWLALILVSVLLTTERTAVAVTLRRLRRDRLAQVVAVLLAGAAAYEQYWYVFVDQNLPTPVRGHQSLAGAWLDSLARIPLWIHEGYGVLGWLDAPSPDLALEAWAGVNCVLVLFAVLGARGRARLVPAFALVGGLLLSVTLEAVFRNALGGNWWQGRYSMPYLSGLPLLCGAVGAATWRWDRWTAQVLLRWTVLPLAAGSVFTYYWVLHRYGAGMAGPWSPGSWTWSPPGSAHLLLMLYLSGSLLLAAVLVRGGRAGREYGPGGSATGTVDLTERSLTMADVVRSPDLPEVVDLAAEETAGAVPSSRRGSGPGPRQ